MNHATSIRFALRRSQTRLAARTLMFLGTLTLTGILLTASSTAAQMDHGDGQPARPELDRPSPIPLDPASGAEVGFVYEAFLSPQQEGGEEEDTPALIPSTFRSTAPSVPRNERPSQGHAVLEFTNDLSRAYVHLAIANVNIETINMLHLHCGRPGQLGPIIVDFSLAGDLHEYLADGVLTLEITNRPSLAAWLHSMMAVSALIMSSRRILTF